MSMLTITLLLVGAHAAPPADAPGGQPSTSDLDSGEDRFLIERQPPLTVRDPIEECKSLPSSSSANAYDATPWDGLGPEDCIPADINDGVIWDMELDGLRVGAIIVVREDSAWADANQEYWAFGVLPPELDWSSLGPCTILATAMEWDDIGIGGPTEVLLDDICNWQQSVGATEWEVDRDSYVRTELQSGGKPPPSATILVPSPARMLQVFQRKSTSYYLWLDMVTNPATPEVRWYEAKAGWDSGGAFTALKPGLASDVWDTSFDLVPGPQFNVYEETSVSTHPSTTFCENYLGLGSMP